MSKKVAKISFGLIRQIWVNVLAFNSFFSRNVFRLFGYLGWSFIVVLHLKTSKRWDILMLAI